MQVRPHHGDQLLRNEVGPGQGPVRMLIVCVGMVVILVARSEGGFVSEILSTALGGLGHGA